MNPNLVALVLFPGIAVIGLNLIGSWRLGGKRAPNRGAKTEPAETRPPGNRLGSFGLWLQQAAAAGQQDAILRKLDRELPEWPASSTLIEAVRELFALASNLKSARGLDLLETITTRLGEDIKTTAELLWLRAERLRESIRESRSGLSEMMLAGHGLPDNLERAERRFRVLAATAREMQEFDRESRQ